MQKYLHSYLPKICICNYRLQEKDSQIDKFIGGMSQKDELISDYLYMLKHLTADRFKNSDNGMLKGNPKPYKELQEKE